MYISSWTFQNLRFIIINFVVKKSQCNSYRFLAFSCYVYRLNWNIAYNRGNTISSIILNKCLNRPGSAQTEDENGEKPKKQAEEINGKPVGI